MGLMKIQRKVSGFTLVEIMIAVAIFLTIGVISALSIASFHGNLQIQHERVQAVQLCKSVIQTIREKRKDFWESNFDFNGSAFFQWIMNQNTESWLNLSGFGNLPNRLRNVSIAVDCRNMDGSEANGLNYPMQVYVSVTWQSGVRGYPLREVMGAIISTR